MTRKIITIIFYATVLPIMTIVWIISIIQTGIFTTITTTSLEQALINTALVAIILVSVRFMISRSVFTTACLTCD